jgi:hypothetical protein
MGVVPADDQQRRGHNPGQLRPRQVGPPAS